MRPGDRRHGRAWGVAALAGAVLVLLLLPPGALAQGEGPDFEKTDERNDYIVKTPEFQRKLNERVPADAERRLAIETEEAVAGPDRRAFDTNVCFSRSRECAGDVRLYDWEEQGFGQSEEVLFGARSGATISAQVWATEDGPAKRPGIVITTGSVQAPETLYWSFAQVLAKRGYVVLTYDVQGQGQSDTQGEAPDSEEGVPSQQGQPFYDGTEDALDFLLSTKADPYVPRDSCGNANGGVGTSHAAKHERRVELGLNAPFNPFWELVDPKRVGIAGHSLGAGAVSYIGQLDDRVDAIVAWDNLATPGNGFGSRPDCPSGSSPRPADPGLTKPAIGMSNDYGLFTDSNFGDPDGQDQNEAFIDYGSAGIDSMQVNRRGGTHYEYSFIPGVTVPPLGLATLRGNDMAVWYTFAWLDRYVRCQGDTACQVQADRRLLTDRWRDDPREGQVDYGGDSNMYSSNLFSRFDFTDASGDAQICDDMRAGCTNMAPDGDPPGYDFLAETKTLDGAAGPSGPGGPGNPDAEPCSVGQRGSDADDTPHTLPPTDAGDSISGHGGDDKIRGGFGPDCIYGQGGGDIVKGEEDADTLRGGPGSDRTIGGGGDDDARGSDGKDIVKGGEGRDKVKGGKGADRVVGGDGRDTLIGGNGNDVIKAADGERDRIVCGKGRRDEVTADRKDRVGRSCERVRIKR